MSSNKRELRDLTAVVSGAASGIGEATARLFADHGASLLLVDQNEQKLEYVVEQLRSGGIKVRAYPGDVATEQVAEGAIAACISEFGRLDMLVNAAGVMHVGTAPQTSLEDWRRIFRINVESVFLTSRLAIPALGHGGGGTIVNVASEAGLVGFENYAAYAASKSAVVGLTRSMALDHAAAGVRINCVCPGSIDTPLLRQFYDRQRDPDEAKRQDELDHPLGIGSASQVAESILFLAGPRSAYITGHALAVDGGYTCR